MQVPGQPSTRPQQLLRCSGLAVGSRGTSGNARLWDGKTYAQAIQNSGKQKQWKEAIATFQRLLDDKSVAPHLQHFSAILGVCAKQRQQRTALWVLGLFDGCRVEPHTFAMNCAINACTDWEEALSVMRELHRRGLAPDLYTYNFAINACQRNSRWDWAVALLQELDESFLEPDVFSYTPAIVACGTAEMPSVAISLFQAMRRRGIAASLVSTNAAITACGTGVSVTGSGERHPLDRSGCWAYALSFLLSARAQRLEPDSFTTVGAVGSCPGALLCSS